MSFEIKVLILFCPILLAVLFLGSGSLSYQDAKLKADQDEALLNLDRLNNLTNVRNKFIQSVLPLCTKVTDEMPVDVNLVLEIGSKGDVKRQWRKEDSKISSCFQKVAVDNFFFWNAGKAIFISFKFAHDDR
jgi:hypothetical protein